MEVISPVNLSGSSALARRSLGLVTLREYKHTLRLGDEYEMLRKMEFAKKKKKGGLIDCDKCICAYTNELWALFVFLFTALTHALVPAWLT